MPNSTLAYDPDAPVFKARFDEIRRGKASMEVARYDLGLQLGKIFFSGLTAVVEKVTGIKDDDVDLEIRMFGPRITGEGGVLLPVNLYVRALQKPKWAGNHQMPNGEGLPKPEAVALLACERIVQLLRQSEFTDFHDLDFDLKLENAPGSYDTGTRARARLAERDTA